MRARGSRRSSGPRCSTKARAAACGRPCGRSATPLAPRCSSPRVPRSGSRRTRRPTCSSCATSSRRAARRRRASSPTPSSHRESRRTGSTRRASAHRVMLDELYEQVAAESERAGDHAAAVVWARRRVWLDPVSEEAQQALLRRLAAVGDRPGALHSFSRFRTRLRADLALAPSPETVALVEAIRSADTATAELPARLAAAAGEAMVGREAELERLSARFRQAGEERLPAVVAVSAESGVGQDAPDRGARETRTGGRPPCRLRSRRPRRAAAVSTVRRGALGGSRPLGRRHRPERGRGRDWSPPLPLLRADRTPPG